MTLHCAFCDDARPATFHGEVRLPGSRSPTTLAVCEQHRSLCIGETMSSESTPEPCRIPDCGREAHASWLCMKHYKRANRLGATGSFWPTVKDGEPTATDIADLVVLLDGPPIESPSPAPPPAIATPAVREYPPEPPAEDERAFLERAQLLRLKDECDRLVVVLDEAVQSAAAARVDQLAVANVAGRVSLLQSLLSRDDIDTVVPEDLRWFVRHGLTNIATRLQRLAGGPAKGAA